MGLCIYIDYLFTAGDAFEPKLKHISVFFVCFAFFFLFWSLFVRFDFRYFLVLFIYFLFVSLFYLCFLVLLCASLLLFIFTVLFLGLLFSLICFDFRIFVCFYC